MDESSETDCLKLYLRDISRLKDGSTKNNLKLVVEQVKRYSGQGVDLMDLIQEGNLALLKGAEETDTVHLIKQAMEVAIKKEKQLKGAEKSALLFAI